MPSLLLDLSLYLHCYRADLTENNGKVKEITFNLKLKRKSCAVSLFSISAIIGQIQTVKTVL